MTEAPATIQPDSITSVTYKLCKKSLPPTLLAFHLDYARNELCLAFNLPHDSIHIDASRTLNVSGFPYSITATSGGGRGCDAAMVHAAKLILPHLTLCREGLAGWTPGLSTAHDARALSLVQGGFYSLSPAQRTAVSALALATLYLPPHPTAAAALARQHPRAVVPRALRVLHAFNDIELAAVALQTMQDAESKSAAGGAWASLYVERGGAAW